ncbi:MAG: hypothetical protein HYU41_09605 [Candidatus Rokubacteria bacterium]|nr:hypothetical protein [Candidatus Rokubacteria bacterium]
MATVLHLLKAGGHPLADETMRREVAAGDRVTVALLDGAASAGVPAGVRRVRVPEDVSYSQLLDLVFEAERVIAW